MVTHILGLRLFDRYAVSIPAAHRRRALRGLTRLQSGSAAALVGFGVVHLSAPLIGLLHLAGGDVNDRIDASSRWMLLGRVAYQSSVGERVLWISLAVHLLSGGVKRLIRSFTVVRSGGANGGGDGEEQVRAAAVPSVTPSRAKLTRAQLSGWLLAPVAVHHALVNRLIPSSPTPPISALSPSELDYSFVSHALSHPNTPARMIMGMAYIGLIGAFAVHATYAGAVLLGSLSNRASTAQRAKQRRYSKATVSWSLAGVLLAGLLSIVPLRQTDKLAISASLKNRYDAVLALAWPTRFFFG